MSLLVKYRRQGESSCVAQHAFDIASLVVCQHDVISHRSAFICIARTRRPLAGSL